MSQTSIRSYCRVRKRKADDHPCIKAKRRRRDVLVDADAPKALSLSSSITLSQGPPSSTVTPSPNPPSSSITPSPDPPSSTIIPSADPPPTPPISAITHSPSPPSIITPSPRQWLPSSLTTSPKPRPPSTITPSPRQQPPSSITTSTRPRPSSTITPSPRQRPPSSITTSTRPRSPSTITPSPRQQPPSSITTSTRPRPPSTITPSPRRRPPSSITTSTRPRPPPSMTLSSSRPSSVTPSPGPSSSITPSPGSAVKPRTPAYKRYHSLLADPPVPVPSSSSPSAPVELPLPLKYQVLEEKFRCTDTVVTMLQKRKEICTLDKLKQAVQEMTRRTFEQRNLAQMKTVYPSAFIFRQEKNIPGNYDRKKYEKFQLTVETNVDEGVSEEKGDEEKGCKRLGGSFLIKRRKQFHQNLIQIVQNHHKDFLASLNPPLVIPDAKILRWHPSFSLDTIPDVEEGELPKPPVAETYMTAKDVLNIAHNKMAPRVQRALENVSRETEGHDGGAPNTPKTAVNPMLKGISEDLLAKIRQKEAMKAEAAITRDPLKEKRLEMLGRLPEFCRILRVFFLAEKKAAIPWDNVVQKLGESHASYLSSDRVEEHLQYLEELIPRWMKCITIRRCRYVKLNRNIDAKYVTKQLESAEKELRT